MATDNQDNQDNQNNPKDHVKMFFDKLNKKINDEVAKDLPLPLLEFIGRVEDSLLEDLSDFNRRASEAFPAATTSTTTRAFRVYDADSQSTESTESTETDELYDRTIILIDRADNSRVFNGAFWTIKNEDNVNTFTRIYNADEELIAEFQDAVGVYFQDAIS